MRERNVVGSWWVVVRVNIGLRLGSALIALYFFIMVMELISREISTKGGLRKMMHADDLATIAEGKEELQEVMEEWMGVFNKHGLKISLEKNDFGGWAFRGRGATSDKSGSEC